MAAIQCRPLGLCCEDFITENIYMKCKCQCIDIAEFQGTLTLMEAGPGAGRVVRAHDCSKVHLTSRTRTCKGLSLCLNILFEMGRYYSS